MFAGPADLTAGASGSRSQAVKLERSSSPTEPGQNSVTDEAEDVRKVREKWRIQEDHSVASKLQEKEFEHHFESNRSERRLVSGDIKKTKEEQELEDKFAAEYFEQLKKDQETADADLALRMQHELEEEESRQMLEAARRDEEIAKSIQIEESRLSKQREGFNDIAQNDASFAGELQKLNLENDVNDEKGGKAELARRDFELACHLQRQEMAQKNRAKSGNSALAQPKINNGSQQHGPNLIDFDPPSGPPPSDVPSNPFSTSSEPIGQPGAYPPSLNPFKTKPISQPATTSTNQASAVPSSTTNSGQSQPCIIFGVPNQIKPGPRAGECSRKDPPARPPPPRAAKVAGASNGAADGRSRSGAGSRVPTANPERCEGNESDNMFAHQRLYPDEGGVYLTNVERAAAEKEAQAAREEMAVKQRGHAGQRLGVCVLPPGLKLGPKKF